MHFFVAFLNYNIFVRDWSFNSSIFIEDNGKSATERNNKRKHTSTATLIWKANISFKYTYNNNKWVYF